MSDENELCDECGHKVSLHGPEGCEYERGDSYTPGYAPMALGPCGCTAWTLEPVDEPKASPAKP